MNVSDLNSRRNSAYLVIAVGVVFIAVILFRQLASAPTQYERKIAQLRDQTDFRFKHDPQSPIPASEREAFQGLRYFPADPGYAVPASLTPETRPDTMRLMTTQGSDYLVVRAGVLNFELQGRPYALAAYRYLETEGKSGLFVPFRDLTAGYSTYQGGRYLDVPEADSLMLDFNQAYNPYCVYNDVYICPLPPPENRLPVEIFAGEQLPQPPQQ